VFAKTVRRPSPTGAGAAEWRAGAEAQAPVFPPGLVAPPAVAGGGGGAARPAGGEPARHAGGGGVVPPGLGAALAPAPAAGAAQVARQTAVRTTMEQLLQAGYSAAAVFQPVEDAYLEEVVRSANSLVMQSTLGTDFVPFVAIPPLKDRADH
jgi:hypothetical protein